MKILIIKLGAIGDVLRTTSLLPALKEKYRGSVIYWFTKKESLYLLDNNKLIDKVVIYSTKNIELLKNAFFDIVINLDEDFEACSLATKLNKKSLFGFYIKDNKITPTASAKEWFDMSILGKKPQNDILKKKNKKSYQELMCQIIGLDPKNTYMKLDLRKEQKEFAKNFKRRYNIEEKDVIIGINTGSGEVWPSKQYSVKNTALLAEEIYKKYSAKIILFGGKNEIQRNNEIIALARVPIINAGCGNDLLEFPALISICDLFITSDSLGMHIAIALKRKIIALFGPTSASEIELYGLGVKIQAKSNCLVCYKPDCKATNQIKTHDITKYVPILLEKKLDIIITSFKEKNLENTINSIIHQKISYPYNLYLVSPDPEARKLVNKIKKPNIKYFFDPGKGKSYAINLILKELKNDILILSDGDVILEKDSINKIAQKFKDPQVGVVTGRIVSSNPKNRMIDYWSHLLADAGAHRVRNILSKKEEFLECSGYLFAFRNNIIKQIPLDVAEDAIIPYYFYKQGYKVSYAPEAKVFVKNPNNFKDWLKQRKRTSKAHETLTRYIEDFPKVKSFSNEVIKGTFWALEYPKNTKELLWTFSLLFARLYMWTNVFYDTKIKKEHYKDAWERVESTK